MGVLNIRPTWAKALAEALSMPSPAVNSAPLSMCAPQLIVAICRFYVSILPESICAPRVQLVASDRKTRRTVCSHRGSVDAEPSPTSGFTWHGQSDAPAAPRSPVKRQDPIFIVLALAWLPLGILAISLLRGLPFLGEPTALLSALPSLLVTAPFGLPLALACRLIHGLQRPRAAWISFAVLAPLTALASIGAGLLGPHRHCPLRHCAQPACLVVVRRASLAHSEALRRHNRLVNNLGTEIFEPLAKDHELVPSGNREL